MPVKTIDETDFVAGLTEDDIKRTAQDGFISIRDEAGHLLMRYNPAKNLIEIKRRGYTTTIDLDLYRKQAEQEKVTNMLKSEILFWQIMIDARKNQSDTIAIQQDGDHAGRPND
jgi:hypothetical protein